MNSPPRRPVTLSSLLTAWGRILTGHSPLLSIELTRECPLRCPGCYAYTDNHLGGKVTLRQLHDLTGDALVDRVLSLVRVHRPLQLSIIGGEPLIRHKELSRLLPILSAQGVYTLVVSSAVIPFPKEWNGLPRIRIAVSIDGLQAEHDRRRHPATYERILKNICGRKVDISWVITNQMMRDDGYLDEYLRFWTARPEVERIWLSLYTPQKGERSDEILTIEARTRVLKQLPGLKARYPGLIFPDGAITAMSAPPRAPSACTFSKLSVNYSADLKTRVEPCFFGGNPDCSQCGCAVSTGLHWLQQRPLTLGLTVGHLLNASVAVGRLSRHAR